MASIALRRLSAVSSAAFLKSRPLAAVFNSSQPLFSLQSNLSNSAEVGKWEGSVPAAAFGGGVKAFHSGRGLNFRASEMCRAQALAHQEVDEGGLEIDGLGIAREIVNALAQKGITKLFPIQRAVLDPAMQGRDMIARAKTGTGKTLAFGIPILDKITQYRAQKGRTRNPLAVVLAPTRELAKQVDKEFSETAPHLDTLCVYGGTPIFRQMSQLNRGVDVVVGTPGRVIDLLNRGALNLSEIKFAVLDEADEMMKVGFAEAVEEILAKSPKQRQTMMFSATLPNDIMKIINRHIVNPLFIDLVGEDDQKLAEGISLYSITSESYGKASIIGPLIKEYGKGGKAIVFTATKREADRLSQALSSMCRGGALHGDVSQDQRERTLASFRSGNINVLFATDVAARGLDIPNVELVIHYDLPNNSEIFVHRSGRTGRAGKKGTAILIHTHEQNNEVRGIERDIASRFQKLPEIAGDPSIRLMNSPRYVNGGGPWSSQGRSSGYGRPGSSRSQFGSFGSLNSSQSGGFGRGGDFGGSSSGRGFSHGDDYQSTRSRRSY